MTTADALPEDMRSLRAAAMALIAERDELLRRVERMRQIIRQFQPAQFGRHSKRLDPDQLQLALEEREIASAHRHAAAPTRELATGFEKRGVGYRGGDCARRDRTDTRNSCEPPTR